MALDFSHLPPEKQDPEPPSRLLWVVVFFVLTIADVFAVLFFWPADEPTHTPLFWTFLALLPAGFAAFVVNRRYSVYEGRRLDVKNWNEARTRYNEQEFSRESIPVLVLGSSVHVTGNEGPGDFTKIADGTLALDTQASGHEDSESLSARWLELLEARLAADDAERHELVLEWLYDQMLTELPKSLAALPVELGLRVRLELSGYVGKVDALKLLKDRWKAHRLHAAQRYSAENPTGLMVLDSWLDESQGVLERDAVLLISISLSAMLDNDPPHGSAEAGIALLMVSTATASRHGLQSIAAIHRPVQSGHADLDDALANALRWGGAGVQDLGSTWMTGFDGDSVGPLHTSLDHVAADARRDDVLREFDLDRTAGNAGTAAGWFAAACAAQEVIQAASPQLIAQRLADQTVLAVVAARNDDLNKTPRSA